MRQPISSQAVLQGFDYVLLADKSLGKTPGTKFSVQRLVNHGTPSPWYYTLYFCRDAKKQSHVAIV
jgi:hypothetical protein